MPEQVAGGGQGVSRTWRRRSATSLRRRCACATCPSCISITTIRSTRASASTRCCAKIRLATSHPAKSPRAYDAMNKPRDRLSSARRHPAARQAGRAELEPGAAARAPSFPGREGRPYRRLDPLATGLLPFCFGEATKIAGHLLGNAKAYRGRCAPRRHHRHRRRRGRYCSSDRCRARSRTDQRPSSKLSSAGSASARPSIPRSSRAASRCTPGPARRDRSRCPSARWNRVDRRLLAVPGVRTRA